MIKPKFHVCVTGVTEIHDMPGSWQDADYHRLLAQLEVEGVDDVQGGDLLDLVLMALQDMEPDDAVDSVLACKLGTDLSKGARQNLVQDFLEDQRTWELAPDIRLHCRIFAVAVLLQKAFPKMFTRPDMMQVVLRIEARNSEAAALLAKPPQAAFVARMLADAMDTHSILERLFDEQLAADRFDEADGIIWLAEFSDSGEADGRHRNLTVYSSEHWLEEMREISEFESGAYNDGALREAGHG